MAAGTEGHLGFTKNSGGKRVRGIRHAIYFRKSQHWYSTVGGVEFVHVGDINVPLIEGVLVVNN